MQGLERIRSVNLIGYFGRQALDRYCASSLRNSYERTMWARDCITPQFSGGALPYVPWHFMCDRPLQLLVMRQRLSARRSPSSTWRMVSAGNPRTRCVSNARSRVTTCETFTTEGLASPDSALPMRTFPGASASARLLVTIATMTVAIRL
jgi:hypothetical protein